jgi:hypothetical protein
MMPRVEMPTSDADLKIGMIGLDTSHAVLFTRLLNDACAPDHVKGAVVTAAFPCGSADMPEKSWNRVEGFSAKVTQFGTKLRTSIEEVVSECDAIMIENVDGRKHLEIARKVLPFGKPVFIDKPLAASLEDGREIVRLARVHGAPLFSASALRYSRPVIEALQHCTGRAREIVAFCPCETEPHHPDLAWYGVHGVEMLYALLGPGCQSVTRVHLRDTDIVVGRWSGERYGILQGRRAGPPHFALKAFFADHVQDAEIAVDYAPLVQQIIAFFRAGVAPVSGAEMLEVLAFMDAADASKKMGGQSISLQPFVGGIDETPLILNSPK